MGPRISLLVPTHGRPQRVQALLACLERQTLAREDFELVLVDDGSQPPLDAAVAEHPLRPTLVRQERAGPAAARNRGLERCRAPLVLILNDDSLPEPGLVAGHLAAQAELARAAHAAPRAVLGSFDFAPRALRSAFTRLLARSDLLFDFPGLVPGAELPWTFFWTCNLSLPRELLVAERFDAERFREPVLEDVELGLRLARRGLRVVHRPELVALHDHALTPAGWLARQARLGANLLRMAEKHADARLLRATRADADREELLRPHQQLFETLGPRLGEALAALEAYEAAWSGREPPPPLEQGMLALCRRIAPVALARGLLEEADGEDPALRASRAPRAGETTTVIVPSCDALERTRACIEALRRCAEPDFPQELVVVDNGSRDGSREWLAAQPDLLLIANAENAGAPRARNQALAHARGSWVVFLDNDVVVTPGWLARLRRHAELDPRAAFVGPLTRRAAHGQAQHFPERAPDELAAELARTRPGGARITGLLSSFCLLARRATLDALGPFDERFSPWGFEDDDLTARALAAGWHNRIALDVYVEHGSYGGERAQRHEALLERNWALFRDKWGLAPDAARGDYGGLEERIRALRAQAPGLDPRERALRLAREEAACAT